MTEQTMVDWDSNSEIPKKPNSCGKKEFLKDKLKEHKLTIDEETEETVLRLLHLSKEERITIYTIIGDIDVNGDDHELVQDQNTFNKLIKAFKYIRLINEE